MDLMIVEVTALMVFFKHVKLKRREGNGCMVKTAIDRYRIPVSHGSTLRLEALGERVDGRVRDVGRAHNVFRTVKDEDGDGEEEADFVNGGSVCMEGGREKGGAMMLIRRFVKGDKCHRILWRCFT